MSESPDVAQSGASLSRIFLAERDLRMFEMRRSGLSAAEIAKRFGVSSKAANTAINRQLSKMSQEALAAYPEILRMELERLDAMQQAIWPLTQHRKVTIGGEEFTAEPDLKAGTLLLSIMAHRTRLLGLDKNATQDPSSVPGTGTAVAEGIRSSVHGAASGDAELGFDSKSESLATLKLMHETGVLDKGLYDSIIEGMGAPEPLALTAAPEDAVTDAEIVDDADEPRDT